MLLPFGLQSCIIRLNKKWTVRENSVLGVLCEVKNKEICYSEIQKTVGMTGFFKKSYKNIRTITDTVIDTIVSVTVSAFLCPFYGK